MVRSNEPEQQSTDIEMFNSLLRCELTAAETYDQAINRFEDERILADLQTIQEEHLQAEILLREKVLALGGEPVEVSQPWSTCAAAMSSATNSTGPATTLAALRQGEEHSINAFEDLLKQEHVNLECQNLIRATLLPAGRKHVAELNRLMGGMS
jgi:hypothetical protein